MRMVRNLTPHAVKIRVEDKEVVLAPEGLVPRIEMGEVREVGQIEIEGVKIPLRHMIAGQVHDLPEEERGTLLVVSAMVRTNPYCSHRVDLISPDTSPAGVIRDEKGNIVGVTGFQVSC